jgi:peptidoglycan/xylan/chitin deacetylase (PgdA/CDA1 family)
MQRLKTIREQPDLWDVYTRKEEYENGLRDKYDRFQHYMSAERTIFEPRVSAHLHANGFRPEYPEDRKFAVCMSHDIDFPPERPDRPEEKLIKVINSIAAKDPKGVLNQVLQMPLRRKRCWNFDDIVALEERYDARSTFFFLAQDGTEEDHAYPLDEEVAREIKHLCSNGWEVGLHGGPQAYLDIEQLRHEKGMLELVLGKEVSGYRGHYLKIRVPHTWRILEQAGFKYDTTLSYADCAGFRNGMCHPFPPFDLEGNCELGIIEVPLIIMDVCLLDVMRLDNEKAWDLAKYLLDEVRRYNGAISILWHNSNMFGDKLKFYERMLNYCSENKAWLTTTENVVEHWKRNCLS